MRAVPLRLALRRLAPARLAWVLVHVPGGQAGLVEQILHLDPGRHRVDGRDGGRRGEAVVSEAAGQSLVGGPTVGGGLGQSGRPLTLPGEQGRPRRPLVGQGLFEVGQLGRLDSPGQHVDRLVLRLFEVVEGALAVEGGAGSAGYCVQPVPLDPVPVWGRGPTVAIVGRRYAPCGGGPDLSSAGTAMIRS